MKNLLLIVIFLIIILKIGKSQNYSSNSGFPFVKSFSHKDYKARSDNFAIAQHNNGLMYFGNFAGIIEFDGISWKTIPTQNQTRVTALAKADNGTIYAGARGEIGFLTSSPEGEIICKQIPLPIDSLKIDNSEYIIDIHPIKNGIYFVSNRSVYLLNNEQVINVIHSAKEIFSSFIINDKLYLSQSNDVLPELFCLSDGKTSKVFVKDYILSEVKAVISSGSEIIVGTSNLGLFKFRNDTVSYFQCASTNFLMESGITCGVKLPDNTMAFGTVRSGIVIVNEKGNIVKIIAKESGLLSENVHKLFVDADNHLWAALSDGIAIVNYPTQLTYFNEKNGIDGQVNDLVMFNNKFFAATNKGVYIYQNNRFVPFLSGVTCWYLTTYKNLLLLATSNGLHSLNNSLVLTQDIIPEFCFSIAMSKTNTNILYVGCTEGLFKLTFKGDKVDKKEKVKSLDNNKITQLISRVDGQVWIETISSGIMVYDENTGIVQNINQITELPPFISYHLNEIDNKLIITTADNVYVNTTGLTFEQLKISNDSIFWTNGADIQINNNDKQWYYLFKKDYVNNLWITMGDGTGVSMYKPAEDGVYIKEPNALLPISTNIINFIYPSNDKSVWLGSSEGLLHFDPNVQQKYEGSFATIIRNVSIGNDLIIYQNGSQDQQNKDYYLKYQHNNITFEFTGPFYHVTGNNLYSYFLEDSDPSDDSWSIWTKNNIKEYTFLPPGKYTFRVKVLTPYGTELKEDNFTFIIKTPWYRTWIAILFYIILLAGIIYYIIKLRSQQLIKEKEQLEMLVKERTEEVVEQKEEIETQRDEITAQRDRVVKQMTQIKEQRDQIADQQKSIMDSIVYARRIQTAILPSESIIQDNLSDFFILYKPRDVVSGDFYWMHKTGNKLLIAVADCTGHGVPGAFMSVLGVSSLNEIVNTSANLFDMKANEIVNRLRQLIIESLTKKNETRPKDGMDLSFCTIDLDSLHLQFAGAYNHLYIYRHKDGSIINNEDNDDDYGNYNVFQIKADKMPIGVHIKENVSFNNNDFDLQKGDALYMFSDGYPDQFGKETGKKFMAKKLKRILSEIQEKPMKEQQTILEKHLADWKGDLEQVDDILVVGLKI